MTRQEVRLWLRLRALRAAGHHVRRQVPIDRYVVDFACIKARLAIELDGGQHSLAAHAMADRERDASLNALGWRVLRFWNAEVNGNIDGVMDTIHPLRTGATAPTRPLPAAARRAMTRA